MGKKSFDIQLPNWFEDPLYQKSQDTLFPYGQNILEGKLPDFYSTLGKTNTPEFNDMLKMVNRDTAKAVNENLVRRGVSRGGVGLSTIAKATADTGTTLRWQDFQRANQEKQWLMGAGLDTLSGVRSAALDITGQHNQFNLNRTQLEIALAEKQAQEKAAKNKMWSDIISSGIGAAAIAFSGGAAAPLVGAGMMGSATGGGQSFGGTSLMSSGGYSSYTGNMPMGLKM